VCLKGCWRSFYFPSLLPSSFSHLKEYSCLLLTFRYLAGLLSERLLLSGGSRENPLLKFFPSFGLLQSKRHFLHLQFSRNSIRLCFYW
jgi:hypothetical protein